MKNLKDGKVIYQLLVILGALFLFNACYRYIHAGYDYHAVPFSTTLIFGILWPVIALKNLKRLKKETKHQTA